LPTFVPPQLCTLVDAAPDGDDWLHEIKYDGYRAIAAIGGGKAVVYTRKGLDWTDKFPSIARALGDLPCRSALLDGEIAIGDREGHTDFGALQQAIGEQGKGVGYYVFDLLNLDGEDLRSRPLIERKRALEGLLRRAKGGGPIFYSDHVVGHGDRVFRRACRLKLEGIVSKRSDAPYRSERSRSWLKAKCGMGQEFVIIGWRPSKVKGRPFSSILLGVRQGDRLVYRGRVGSGFGGEEIDRLWPEFRKRAIEKPAADGVPRSIQRDARYIRPDIVAEIAFRGWTRDGVVRQGSFKGLRMDKKPTEIVAEIPVKTRSVAAKGSRRTGKVGREP
jgi:bifunctional non-homologous end joining protein LigD